MKVQSTVDFLGFEKNSFVDKGGETVTYQKVNVLCPDDGKTLNLSADKDLDFSGLERYSKIDADFEITMNGNYTRVKMVGFRNTVSAVPKR